MIEETEGSRLRLHWSMERSVRGRPCGTLCPAGTCGKEATYRFCEHTWEKLSVATHVRATAVFSILVVTRETENLGRRDGSEALKKK